ncbi:glutathione S-transferase 1: isoform D-like protein, partial [Leptotrombidium deliense]
KTFADKNFHILLCLISLKMGIELYSMVMSMPCRAVLMTAKLINVSLDIKPVDLSKQEQLTNENLIKINPQKCIPTMNDNGFVLWESRAIMRYLIDKYAENNELYPRDVNKRAKIDQLLDFDLGTLDKFQRLFLQPLLFGKPMNREYEANFRNSLKLLDIFVSNKKFVTSDTLTLADISIIASLSFAEACEFDFSGYVNVVKWMKRVKEGIACFDEINKTAMQNFTMLIRERKKSIK